MMYTALDGFLFGLGMLWACIVTFCGLGVLAAGIIVLWMRGVAKMEEERNDRGDA